MAAKSSKKENQFWGTGRRKGDSQVKYPTEGQIMINKRKLEEYFPLETLIYMVKPMSSPTRPLNMM